MVTSTQIRVLVGLVLVAWLAIALAQGQPPSTRLFTSFSYVVSAVSIVVLLWDRWLWAFRVFRPWLTTRPDLRGTWKGQLLSNWIDPGTGERGGPIEAYLVIRQTYSSIDMRLFTMESNSVSLSASVVRDTVGVHKLAATYRNESKVLLREDSPIHYGGVLLDVRGIPVEKLDGEYWTDRGTKGDAAFLTRARRVSHDFNDAARSF